MIVPTDVPLQEPFKLLTPHGIGVPYIRYSSGRGRLVYILNAIWMSNPSIFGIPEAVSLADPD